MNFISKIKDSVEYICNIPLSVLLSVLTVFYLLLFTLHEYLNDYHFKDTYISDIIAIVIIITLILILSKFYSFVGRIIQKLIKTKRNSLVLKNLTIDEKKYLIRFIDENKTSISFRIDDGVILSLKKKGVVCCTAQAFKPSEVPYILNDWVRKEIKNNSRILLL